MKNIGNLFWECDYEVEDGKKMFFIKDFTGNKVSKIKTDTWGELLNIVESHNNSLAETIKAYNIK